MLAKKFGKCVDDGDVLGALLIAKDLNLNQVYKELDGATPLTYSVLYEAEEIAVALIDMGADVTIECVDGGTALHDAASEGCLSIVKPLVEAGADINYQCSDGLTPLHQAAWWDNLDVASLLVNLGADPTIKDKNGSTPKDLAMERKFSQMIEFFENLEPPLYFVAKRK